MENKKERIVAAIKNGTVIDHIPAAKTYQVASLLGLFDISNEVTIGINFASNKVGKKGIIKISDKFFSKDEISRLSVVAPKVILNIILSDKFFSKDEISRLSVVAPKVILNIIHDYEVVEKKTVDTPDELTGIVKCKNPVCITNNEPMKTIFHVIDKERGICKCHYCDKEQEMNKVKLC